MKSLIDEKNFVEEIGITIENMGMPPMQSRILGLLILRMPEGVSFDEIVEFLGASKSTVSSALKIFMQMKQISYYTKPGDRKRYFKIPFSSFWLADLEAKIKSFEQIHQILDMIKNFKEDLEPELARTMADASKLFTRIQAMALTEIEQFKLENLK
jgi:DNA-binding transcriptional regulator GbsR (MarR family)